MKLFSRRTTFQNHLTFLFRSCAAVFACMAALLTLSFVLPNRYFLEQANCSSNEAVCREMRGQYGSFEGLTRSLAQQPELIAALSGGDTAPARRKLGSAAGGEDFPAYYYLLDRDGQVVLSSLSRENYSYCRESRRIARSMEQLEESPRSVVFSADDVMFGGGESTVCHFAAAVADKGGKPTGYLFISLSEKAMETLLWQQKVDAVIVTDPQGQIICSTLPGITRLSSWSPPALKEGHGQVEYNNKQYHVEQRAAGFGIQTFTFSNISTRRKTERALLYCAGGVTAAFAAMLMWAGRKTVARSRQALDHLLAAVRECRAGNLSYRILPDTFDEFQELYDAMNAMMSQMQDLIAKNDEMAKRRRIMEVGHLESQFNPHFVFNLLENLKYMILIDPKKASSMVVGMSRLIRYSINHGRIEVDLRTDLEQIEIYCMLQKNRFGDRLECRLEVPPELLDCKVPKLLLQPIIENSIINNTDHIRQLQVTLTGQREGDNIRFIIQDNGVGIPPGQLWELQQLLGNKDALSEHIGLYNVHRTLQMMYGDAYGITLDSVYRHGVTVNVLIPGRDGNVQSSDCGGRGDDPKGSDLHD